MRSGLASMILPAPLKPTMTQAQIEKRLQYLHLENWEQKKENYNSLKRIVDLMCHDGSYINKAEEIKMQRKHKDGQFSGMGGLNTWINQDLQTNDP